VGIFKNGHDGVKDHFVVVNYQNSFQRVFVGIGHVEEI